MLNVYQMEDLQITAYLNKILLISLAGHIRYANSDQKRKFRFHNMCENLFIIKKNASILCQ
jgi:hypothetical protein